MVFLHIGHFFEDSPPKRNFSFAGALGAAAFVEEIDADLVASTISATDLRLDEETTFCADWAGFIAPGGGGGALLLAFTISATDSRPEEEPSSCLGVFVLDASLGGAGGQILVAVTAGEFG